MPTILACVLLLSTVAQAAPRVALLVVGGSGDEMARAEAQAAGLEVVRLEWKPLPRLMTERSRLRGWVAQAREQYFATHLAAARAIVEQAERESKFQADPEVAQQLGELAVIAALSGDGDGFARAAAAAPALKLDAARWSPLAREGLEQARQANEKSPRVHLTVTPGDAPTFIDGVRMLDGAVEVTVGRHALLALLPESLPVELAIDARRDLQVELKPSPAPTSEERLSMVAARAQAGASPTASERELVETQLSVESALVVNTASPDWRAQLRTAARSLSEACAIHHLPPERARSQRPLNLPVQAGACVTAVHGSFHGGHRDLELDAKFASGAATLAVPASLLPQSDRPYVLEYRLWGETRHGARTAGVGSEAAPLRVLIESDPIPHWYKKWWVWTLVGVGVAGAVIIPAVVLTRPPPTTDVRLVGGQ